MSGERHDAHLVLCVAAVAVEELAHRQCGRLATPAAAFMGLALCGARRLLVHGRTLLAPCRHGVAEVNRNACTVAEAARFIATAPTNLSRLTICGPIHSSVTKAEWAGIVAALASNRCHAFLRRLELPKLFGLDVADAGALLDATNNLEQLRSLSCAGNGLHVILDRVKGGLRQLAVLHCHGGGERFDVGSCRMLRRVGPIRGLPPAVASIDLSHLTHLVRVDEGFGWQCPHLRSLQLPRSVTAIGDGFLYQCTSMVGVLDLSHMLQLQRVGGEFAMRSSFCGVRLPPSVKRIGKNFLLACASLTDVLDVSGLADLQCIENGFAASSSIPGVRLPPSVTSIGDTFTFNCIAMTATLDLSRLTGLLRVGRRFAAASTVPDVLLPECLALTGDEFLRDCECIPARRRTELSLQCD
jgi:hypothetical protein